MRHSTPARECLEIDSSNGQTMTQQLLGPSPHGLSVCPAAYPQDVAFLAPEMTWFRTRICRVESVSYWLPSRTLGTRSPQFFLNCPDLATLRACLSWFPSRLLVCYGSSFRLPVLPQLRQGTFLEGQKVSLWFRCPKR